MSGESPRPQILKKKKNFTKESIWYVKGKEPYFQEYCQHVGNWLSH